MASDYKFNKIDDNITDAAEITLEKNQIVPRIDLHMMGSMFKDLLSEISGEPSENVAQKAQYVKALLNRLCTDRTATDRDFDAAAALHAYRRWEERRELTASLACGYVRVPGESILHFSRKVRRLVDTAAVQRLRNVKQLALVSRVFPGAEHSRFEHALGTFENVIRYVDALCRNGNSAMFLQDVSTELLNCTVIYALLHDLHHFPFYHAFEET